MLLNILVSVSFILLLSYKGSSQTGKVSTGIFAALIYALVWRLVLSVFLASILGFDHYKINVSELRDWLIGILILFFIGIPILSLLSWPAAHLGNRKAIKEGKMLLPDPKKSQKPWVSAALFFYVRIVVVLFALYIFYGMWVHETFKCDLLAWNLPTCFFQSDSQPFVWYLFVLLFFNVALVFVDMVLSRKSFFSKAIFVLDFTLALPAYFLTGVTQAIVFSFPFIAKAGERLINSKRSPDKRSAIREP